MVGALLLGGALLVGLLVYMGNVAAHQQTSQQRRITTKALLRIATTFDNDFHLNRDGAVWDHWDRTSQSVVSRADYINRHARCNNAPGAATDLKVTSGPSGFFEVHSSLAGVKLTDYWHYVDGQWRFSLIKSNPSAVALYREPAAMYYRALGCTK